MKNNIEEIASLVSESKGSLELLKSELKQIDSDRRWLSIFKPIPDAGTTVMATLKFVDYIDWAWWIVLSPSILFGILYFARLVKQRRNK